MRCWSLYRVCDLGLVGVNLDLCCGEFVVVVALTGLHILQEVVLI